MITIPLYSKARSVSSSTVTAFAERLLAIVHEIQTLSRVDDKLESIGSTDRSVLACNLHDAGSSTIDSKHWSSEALPYLVQPVSLTALLSICDQLNRVLTFLFSDRNDSRQVIQNLATCQSDLRALISGGSEELKPSTVGCELQPRHAFTLAEMQKADIESKVYRVRVSNCGLQSLLGDLKEFLQRCIATEGSEGSEDSSGTVLERSSREAGRLKDKEEVWTTLERIWLKIEEDEMLGRVASESRRMENEMEAQNIDRFTNESACKTEEACIVIQTYLRALKARHLYYLSLKCKPSIKSKK